MKKRLLATLMVLCMVLGLLPGTALAMEMSGTCGESVTWTLENGVLTISGTGAMENYYIGYNAPWYVQRGFISEIVLESGVTAIGNYAFYECSSLTSIDIPSSVKSIGTNAFCRCNNLPEINIPLGVTSVGAGAFQHCTSLTIIYLPESVNSIERFAFRGCNNLMSINIPSGITHIEDEMFYDCESLTNIKLPSNITNIGNGAFAYCKCLSSIDIPSSVTKIGSVAFYSCDSLTHIDIPSGVSDIGCHAFASCENLTSVTIPSSAEIFSHYAGGMMHNEAGCIFNSPQLKTVGPIGEDYNIQFGWTEKIPDLAFRRCYYITSVTIPSGITSIGNSAFRECSQLVNITIPDTVISIGDGAFLGDDNLTNIIIPDSVTNIGSSAFRGCNKLKSITIPEGVTEIKYETFHNCSSLTSIVLPISVTHIEAEAFGQTELTDVYYAGSEDEWRAIDIDPRNIYNDEGNAPLLNATIHYNSTGPDDTNQKTISGVLRSGDGYSIRWACVYKEDADGTPSDGVLTISTKDSNTFDELYIYDDSGEPGFPWEREPYNIPKSAITELFILGRPTKHLILTANSFQGYTGLKSVLLDCVTGIDAYAFEGCTALKGVYFSTSGTSFANIGKGAFKNCTKLSDFDFQVGVEIIGAEAFQNTALSGAITLGTSTKEIGENAFAGCKNLLIRCYENSVAHQYAVENNIPFELIDYEEDNTSLEEKTVNYHLGLAGQVEMQMQWGWKLFESSSSDYNVLLSTAGLALSASAEYSETEVKDLLKNFGFQTTDSQNYGQDWREIAYPGVAFGYQEVNGEHIFAVVIRGTNSDEVEDIISDIMLFSLAAKNIHEQLDHFIQINCKLNLSDIVNNSKFLVTGHSLGGGTANILAHSLSDIYGVKNVYGYMFAPPRVIDPITNVLDGDKYPNICNVINSEDGVTRLPPGVTLFSRFGWEMSFHRSKTSGFYDKFYELTGREFNDGFWIFGSDSAHDVAVYMAFVLTGQLSTTIRVIKCACPVDVEVYDATGELVGCVADNAPSVIEEEKVFIYVDGDEKVIYILEDDEYTVKMTGTGEGTMTYSVQDIDMNGGQALVEKVFKNVALTPGKQLTSNTMGMVADVPLYVLGSDGEPEKEVLPDGNGTEVPIETPDDPPVSCEHEYAATVTAPTCTEQGYTTYTCGKCGDSYTDSYTAALGHSYGEWTVVIPATSTTDGQQERICSLCGNKQTSTIPATGESGTDTPDYGSSTRGDSSSITYNITVPAVVGGTISISPKSAAKGATVTISVSPNSGYELISVTVLDSNSNAITLTDKGNGKYTFTMPGGKVTVDAVFQPVQVDTPNATDNSWSNPFTDVANNAWYYDAVSFVNEAGLMNGTSDSVFSPDEPLSRAMLAQILYNKEGRPIVASSIFTDVVSGAWYAGAVSWAAADGIVGGYGNGLFGPDDNITREQLAVMLWRYAGEPAATDKELHFNDADTASTYAIDALRWAAENGIITGYGDGILAPGGQATRAQVAQMLMIYLTK